MNLFITIMLYEWKHFLNSPFKLISVVFFALAAIYGLQNGYSLFEKQKKEIISIQEKDKQDLEEIIGYYKSSKKGPEAKPWIDYSQPMWAVAYAPTTLVKSPSAYLLFSIGQAEQFGYYKRIEERSSVLDADLSEEISNPERLAIGTIDFSFVVLYLLPILAIILLFNVGGTEKDLGFYRTIQVNCSAIRTWFVARFTCYFLLLTSLLFVLMFLYAIRVHAVSLTFFWIYLLVFFYGFLWFATFYFINIYGKGSSNQAIKMISIWLLFCLIIPAGVYQVASIKFPTNYMSDYLDVSRNDTYAIYDLPPDTIKKQLIELYPELLTTPVGKESKVDPDVMGNCTSALVNPLVKRAVLKIHTNSENKNKFIKNTTWFNPVCWFQNKLNALSHTDYYAYHQYHAKIQAIIDKKVTIILRDSWNKVHVNEQIFANYLNEVYQ